MSEAKFTPGPWSLSNIRALSGRYGPPAEREANARLMAAAPALYEAARQVADQIETIEGRTKGDDRRLCDLRAVLQAALALASGDTP